MPDGANPAGVNVIGYLNERSGLGSIVRVLLDSLRAAGVPFAVGTVGKRPVSERFRRRELPFATTIICVNPDVLPSLVQQRGHAFFHDRRTIGFWWWEVERLPPVLGAAAYLVDEIWVGSGHVARAVGDAVRTPVHVFPVPVRAPEPAPIDRSALGLPRDSFVFLFSFSFRSVFERKNPLGLIEAFARAFDPGEGPVLVLKTSHGEWHRDEAERLRAAAAVRPDILLLEGEIDEARYAALVAAADAYVSLHRAEGLGLTIAEAMALGKPAIATAYSGNLEFMTEENSYLVPYRMTPIPAGTGPYPADAEWAEPDIDAAAERLRAVVRDPADAATKAQRALFDIGANHSIETAAAFLRDRLQAVPPPRSAPIDPLERAVYELMWGPDLQRARPWARRARVALAPLLRPYTEQQRAVGVLLAEAIRDRESNES